MPSVSATRSCVRVPSSRYNTAALKGSRSQTRFATNLKVSADFSEPAKNSPASSRNARLRSTSASEERSAIGLSSARFLFHKWMLTQRIKKVAIIVKNPLVFAAVSADELASKNVNTIATSEINTISSGYAEDTRRSARVCVKELRLIIL